MAAAQRTSSSGRCASPAAGSRSCTTTRSSLADDAIAAPETRCSFARGPSEDHISPLLMSSSSPSSPSSSRAESSNHPSKKMKTLLEQSPGEHEDDVEDYNFTESWQEPSSPERGAEHAIGMNIKQSSASDDDNFSSPRRRTSRDAASSSSSSMKSKACHKKPLGVVHTSMLSDIGRIAHLGAGSRGSRRTHSARNHYATTTATRSWTSTGLPSSDTIFPGRYEEINVDDAGGRNTRAAQFVKNIANNPLLSHSTCSTTATTVNNMSASMQDFSFAASVLRNSNHLARQSTDSESRIQLLEINLARKRDTLNTVLARSRRHFLHLSFRSWASFVLLAKKVSELRRVKEQQRRLKLEASLSKFAALVENKLKYHTDKAFHELQTHSDFFRFGMIAASKVKSIASKKDEELAKLQTKLTRLTLELAKRDKEKEFDLEARQREKAQHEEKFRQLKQENEKQLEQISLASPMLPSTSNYPIEEDDEHKKKRRVKNLSCSPTSLDVNILAAAVPEQDPDHDAAAAWKSKMEHEQASLVQQKREEEHELVERQMKQLHEKALCELKLQYELEITERLKHQENTLQQTLQQRHDEQLASLSAKHAAELQRYETLVATKNAEFGKQTAALLELRATTEGAFPQLEKRIRLLTEEKGKQADLIEGLEKKLQEQQKQFEWCRETEAEKGRKVREEFERELHHEKQKGKNESEKLNLDNQKLHHEIQQLYSKVELEQTQSKLEKEQIQHKIEIFSQQIEEQKKVMDLERDQYDEMNEDLTKRASLLQQANLQLKSVLEKRQKEATISLAEKQQLVEHLQQQVCLLQAQLTDAEEKGFQLRKQCAVESNNCSMVNQKCEEYSSALERVREVLLREVRRTRTTPDDEIKKNCGVEDETRARTDDVEMDDGAATSFPPLPSDATPVEALLQNVLLGFKKKIESMEAAAAQHCSSKDEEVAGEKCTTRVAAAVAVACPKDDNSDTNFNDEDDNWNAGAELDAYAELVEQLQAKLKDTKLELLDVTRERDRLLVLNRNHCAANECAA
ncbi:unnamed protein product [Amoebophrya sp. A120]|nr:unnamed protein product [Amoebophrya sp. A120]|eukprot:GSA120T00016043001.1